MWSVLALTASGSSDLIFWEMFLRLSRHTGNIECGHTRVKSDVIREMMEYLLHRKVDQTRAALNATVPLRHESALMPIELSGPRRKLSTVYSDHSG